MALVGLLASLAPLTACSDDDQGSTGELCAALADIDGPGTVFADFDPTDPEAALEQLRTARVELGELQAAAPDEVRDAFEVEIAYVQALIEGLDEVPDGDATAAVAMVQAITEAHPDVQGAADQLEAFTVDSC
ncbi:MAG: hypothetical protein ACSLFP_02500 [Acidimicrobiales bacterium]